MPRLNEFRASGRRAGFTLVELLVALVVFGLIGGTIISVVARQQRFYRGATEIIDTRSQLRQAASVLPTDLRGVSSVSGDIFVMQDTAVEFRANIGSALLCEKSADGKWVYTAPKKLASRNTLTSWYDRPVVGDTMFIFNDSTDAGAVDDDWYPYEITQVDSSTSGYCAGAPFTQAADAGQYRYAFRTTDANLISTKIAVGSAIRFTRRVRYDLYKAADNQWYLGYSAYVKGSGMSGVQPVAGPYRPYSATATDLSGLTFVYTDSTGVVTTDRFGVARVDVALYGSGTEKKNAASYSARKNNTVFTDTMIVRTSIRNRS